MQMGIRKILVYAFSVFCGECITLRTRESILGSRLPTTMKACTKTTGAEVPKSGPGRDGLPWSLFSCGGYCRALGVLLQHGSPCPCVLSSAWEELSYSCSHLTQASGPGQHPGSSSPQGASQSEL
jgi:hypothetical protein